MNGHHENLAADEMVKTPSERSFGLTFFVVFGLIAAWLFWRKHSPDLAIAAASVSIVSLAGAYLAPALLRPFNRAWAKLGALLHRVINPIIMGLLFFLVFTPMGIVMRRSGKDFMGLARAPESDSYWVRRGAEAPVGSMKKQF